MTPDDIKLIIDEVIRNNSLIPWWSYVLFILLPLAGSFFGSIIKKKAEIIATEKYTKELQELSHKYQLLVEQHKAHTSLRLAAIDKRLLAHQQAYALWAKLLSELHGENITSAVIECQNWWNENCLYLSPESREAFNNAYLCASNHSSYLNVPPKLKDNNLIKSNFEEITKAGNIFVHSVELPSLSNPGNLDERDIKNS